MPEWANYVFDKIVLAVLVGLITSSIFLLMLSRLRPRLNISPNIARGTSTKTQQIIYRIKVINRSRYPLTDIRAQLHIYKNYQTAAGDIWKSEALTLTRPDPIIIDKYDKNDSEANYAYRFVTYDLDNRWSDDTTQFVRFRVFARHSLSGFGGFFCKDYRLKRVALVNGDFVKGDAFDVV